MIKHEKPMKGLWQLQGLTSEKRRQVESSALMILTNIREYCQDLEKMTNNKPDDSVELADLRSKIAEMEVELSKKTT